MDSGSPAAMLLHLGSGVSYVVANVIFELRWMNLFLDVWEIRRQIVPASSQAELQ